MAAASPSPEWSLTETSIVFNGEKIPYSSITYLRLDSASLYLITSLRDYRLPFSPEEREWAESAHAYILHQLRSAETTPGSTPPIIPEHMPRVLMPITPAANKNESAPMANDDRAEESVLPENTPAVHESVRPAAEKSKSTPEPEEKTLIASPQFDRKDFFRHVLIVGAILSVGLLLLSWVANWGSYYYDFGFALFVCFLFFCVIALIGGLIALWVHSNRLVVTNKRVYGTGPFGKQVELPIDSITALATLRLLGCISVSSPSGRICFYGISNAGSIYQVISKQLIKRQS